MRKFLTIFLLGGVVGKLLGLVRELLMASMFGTGVVATACRLSLSCIIMPSKLLSAEMQTGGFMPLFSKAKARGDEEEAACLFWIFLGASLVLSIGIAGLLAYSAPFWISKLAPGLNEEEHLAAVSFLHILSLGLPAVVTSVVLSSLAMANGRSGIAASQASMQSLGLIGGIGGAYFSGNILLLPIGILIGWYAYLIFALTGVRSYLPSISTNALRARARNTASVIIRTVLPMLPVPLLEQGNLVVERIVASYMGGRVIPALDYSRFICDTAMALVAMPLGYAILGHLGHYDLQRLRVRLVELVAPIILFGSLGSFWLFSSGEFIVKLLYERGQFGAQDVILTSSILSWSMIGMWAYTAGYVLLRGLNISLQGKRYFLSLLIAVSVSMISKWFLWPYLGPAALGVSYALYSGTLLLATLTHMKIKRLFLKECGPLLIPFAALCLMYVFDVAGMRNSLILCTSSVAACTVLSLCIPKVRRQTLSLFIRKKGA
ncbi:hypothetical protein N1030_13910 [Desulfovibrio mangrovi]|uniref:lipid II flippase MurJ n=1 Tax=Desulfovibrio mangrovi TaxID=2976983 RepID=UPI002245B35B|nr:lipid II flippase MurJ [Desulfovibrio mangrovi]UZP66696.1 hypothetical protein N1030_13910 [Desulfovibrio mangrovi]